MLLNRPSQAQSRTYSLRVDLADVGQSLGQHVTGHLISILVSELSSLALSTLRKRTGIRDRAGHDAANRRRDLEDVRDGRRVDQFVLSESVSSRRLGIPCPSQLIEAARLAECTYRNLLLRENDGAVLAPDAYRHDIRGCDRLEGIFCTKAHPSVLLLGEGWGREGSSPVDGIRSHAAYRGGRRPGHGTYRLGRVDPARRRW
jgi:hypothetical protein